MFKNLIRLRLLEFFELTAAIGGALYVYQTSGWRDVDKAWVITALCASGVVTWVVVRLGRENPIPFLFAATYGGAIGGLTDLSPWMAILGRATIIEWANYLFDVPEMSPQKSQAIALLVTAFLMLIPAVISAMFWSAAYQTASFFILKKEFPTDRIQRIRVLTSPALACLIIGVASYFFLLRPQIRHVRTIRISQSDWDRAIFLEKVRAPVIATPIAHWLLSNDSLACLRADNHFFEFSIADGNLIRGMRLRASPQHLVQMQEKLAARFNSPRPIPKSRAPELFERFCYWNAPDERSFLLSTYPDFQLYDLQNGSELSDSRLDELQQQALLAVSRNGRFAVLVSEIEPAKLHVWDLQKLKRLCYETMAPDTVATRIVQIDNLGAMVRSIESEQNDARISERSGVIDSISGQSFRYHFPELSEDGNWLFSARGLGRYGDKQNLLERYSHCDLHGCLDTHTGRVAMFATAADDYSNGRETYIRVPIIESLLSRAQHSQITLFDPRTQSESTSCIQQGTLKRPDLFSAKFTPDGRYLIIQDEDNSADLFHIFAMP